MKKNRTKKSYRKSADIIGRTRNFFIIVVVVIILDRITKYLAYKDFNGEIALIPHILSLNFTVNKGAAFGILFGETFILSIISIIFIALIIYNLKFILGEDYYFAAALVLGGAFANLFDRIAYGFVIDFIEVPFFSIFNLADTAITIGAIILFVYLIMDKKHD